MKRNTLTLFFCFLFISIKLFAQTDTWSGTWQMEYLPDASATPVNIELQIASSEKDILYPAHLKLQCDDFTADYEFLLVKKSIRELGISKNKYAVSENPFSLGNYTKFLNGIFDNSRGAKGVQTLTAIRIESKLPNILMPDTMHFTKAQQVTAVRLHDFLKDAEIILKKVNDSPWKDERADRILSSHLSPAYFGLTDTVHVQTRNGTMNLSSDKKTAGDIVSVGLNGSTIVDGLLLTKKEHEEDIFLDTGLNILTLFAENFGNGLPNRGKVNLEFDNKKITLNFTNKADSAATFIVAKLYYDHDEEQDKSFQNYTPTDLNEKPLQKNDKLLGSIVSTDQHIILAVWDDAIEDGDSVSININGQWIAQGMRVKIKPQLIDVTLKPGPNTITFIADNLGSIPPNTSVLEIIDGNKRKSFTIETTPEENNLIKIFYDFKAN
jgi:hypothetical protein